MSSDPYEAAAWRAFGMLDSDEAAGFDEAMRQDPELRDAYGEINHLCAAIAAASVAPITPRAGQLERIQARLGLQSSKSANWLGVSGWAAAAAAVAFILIVDQKSPAPMESVKNSAAHQLGKREVHRIQKTTQQVATADESLDQAPEVDPEVDQEPRGEDKTAKAQVATEESNTKSVAKADTRDLLREITVLREKLESVEKREQQRLEAVQGLAWPIVMTMRPPQATAQIVAANDADNSVVGLLGDALAAKSASVADSAALGDVKPPSAVPIYDPATGEGTLVASNVSDTNLWVIPRGGEQPYLLGRIPQSSAAYESVGFRLPTGTIPANFIITNDSEGKGAPPSDKNTILTGPK